MQKIPEDRTSSGITGIFNTGFFPSTLCICRPVFRDWKLLPVTVLACKIVNVAHAGAKCTDAVHGVFRFSENCGRRERQNVPRKSMFTGIGVGLAVGLCMCLGHWLCSKGMYCQDFSPQITAVSQSGFRLSGKALHQKTPCYRSTFSVWSVVIMGMIRRSGL